MHQPPPAIAARQPLRSALAAALGALALLASDAVSAAEFCVSCETPNAHYKCVLPGPAADPADTRLKLWCMTELAKAGSHASCSIDRQQQASCDGAIKSIALPPGYMLGPAPTAPETAGGNEPPAPNSIPPQQQPSAAPAAQASKPAAGGVSGEIIIPKSQQDSAVAAKKPPPESSEGAADTATDAAKGAADAAATALNKAGKAVGNAAQKTWTCITSFFGDC